MKRLSLAHFSTDSFNRRQEAHRKGTGHGCGCVCSYICSCTCSLMWMVTDRDFSEDSSIFLVKEEDGKTVRGPLPQDPIA